MSTVIPVQKTKQQSRSWNEIARRALILHKYDLSMVDSISEYKCAVYVEFLDASWVMFNASGDIVKSSEGQTQW